MDTTQDENESIFSGAPYPHCDELVLHAPSTCYYCDHYPKMQQERISQGINFTGEDNPTKKPDPATERRPLERINRWHGNIAITKEDCERESREWDDLCERLAHEYLAAKNKGYTTMKTNQEVDDDDNE